MSFLNRLQYASFKPHGHSSIFWSLFNVTRRHLSHYVAYPRFVDSTFQDVIVARAPLVAINTFHIPLHSIVAIKYALLAAKPDNADYQRLISPNSIRYSSLLPLNPSLQQKTVIGYQRAKRHWRIADIHTVYGNDWQLGLFGSFWLIRIQFWAVWDSPH